jgi:hypothetical protein
VLPQDERRRRSAHSPRGMTRMPASRSRCALQPPEYSQCEVGCSRRVARERIRSAALCRSHLSRPGADVAEGAPVPAQMCFSGEPAAGQV